MVVVKYLVSGLLVYDICDESVCESSIMSVVCVCSVYIDECVFVCMYPYLYVLCVDEEMISGSIGLNLILLTLFHFDT